MNKEGKMAARLGSRLIKVHPKILRLGNKSGKGIPLPRLLTQMDAYDWDLVEDIPIDEEEKRKRLRYFNELINASMMELNGSILDLASGGISLAYLYPEAVAVDNDPQKIKRLRKDRIKAILADIESLPFEEKSFDYVVSISPPQKLIILHTNGYVRFDVDQVYNKKIIDAALKIARKKVLIASYHIALSPLYEHIIERRDTDKQYYVVYKASNNLGCPDIF